MGWIEGGCEFILDCVVDRVGGVVLNIILCDVGGVCFC